MVKVKITCISCGYTFWVCDYRFDHGGLECIPCPKCSKENKDEKS